MRDEIAAAVVFLTKLVKKNDTLTKEQVDTFSDKLSSILVERFKNHWYKDNPLKGQGYRCIRINDNGLKDAVLEKAAVDSGLTFDDLRLPRELTLWVDPDEVCCRFGENKGSWCTLAKFKDGVARRTADMVQVEDALSKQELCRRMEEVTGHRVTRSNNRRSAGSPAAPAKDSSPKVCYNQQNQARQRRQAAGHYKTGGSSLNIHATPFRAHPARGPSAYPSAMDRYHWVRGADLIKV